MQMRRQLGRSPKGQWIFRRDKKSYAHSLSQNGIPSGFSSCHTAIAGKYFIEGHVPAESISTLIKYQPDIVGIALPGRIDQDNPEEIEMGFPEEVIYFSSDGLYKPFDERIF